MKIKWTREIPNKIGRYLVKCPTTGIIEVRYISQQDFDIQKKWSSYLLGLYYSERIEEDK